MSVKRIVANIKAPQPAAAKAFYHDLLGLELLMNHGWIQTYGQDTAMPVQISFASEGGSATPVPDLSIEVDNLDELLARHEERGFPARIRPCYRTVGCPPFFRA